MSMLTAILILSGLGVIFGIGLAFAARKFCVKADPRLEKVYARLPGINCGACGKPGCMGFAEALMKGECLVEGCVVSSLDAKKEIADVLGVVVKEHVKQVAVLHCHGGSGHVKDKYQYNGIRDCIAANLVMAGPKECVYGCIGFGTCARACPFGAISMSAEDLPVVDESKCTACNKCVVTCPKKLFSLVPITKAYAVRCKSLDKGKEVLNVCSVGCIACAMCQKECPTGAIKVVDNLAVIDYHICDNRGACFRVCPRSSIAKKENSIWVSK